VAIGERKRARFKPDHRRAFGKVRKVRALFLRRGIRSTRPRLRLKYCHSSTSDANLHGLGAYTTRIYSFKAGRNVLFRDLEQGRNGDDGGKRFFRVMRIRLLGEGIWMASRGQGATGPRAPADAIPAARGGRHGALENPEVLSQGLDFGKRWAETRRKGGGGSWPKFLRVVWAIQSDSQGRFPPSEKFTVVKDEQDTRQPSPSIPWIEWGGKEFAGRGKYQEGRLSGDRRVFLEKVAANSGPMAVIPPRPLSMLVGPLGRPLCQCISRTPPALSRMLTTGRFSGEDGAISRRVVV